MLVECSFSVKGEEREMLLLSASCHSVNLIVVSLGSAVSQDKEPPFSPRWYQCI